MSIDFLVFDVSTPMVNFRKFFSTTTSLSYYFPPRTTICGLISSMLGLKRDSYYEKFSTDKCRIALEILTPLRKIVQKVNYLDTDEISIYSLRGIGRKSQRVQVSIEFVVSNLPNKFVSYRIFFYHEDSNLLNEVENRLLNKKFFYIPSLGPAFCVSTIQTQQPIRIKAKLAKFSEPVNISTVIPTEIVGEIPSGSRIFFEARVPVSFNKGRIIDRTSDYILQIEGKKIENIKINGDVFHINLSGENIYGVFME